MSVEAPELSLREPSGLVAADMIPQGVWLSRAAQRFGDRHLVAEYEAAADAFQALSDGETAEAFRFSSRLSGRARDNELESRLIGKQKAAWRLFVAREGLLKVNLNAKLHFGNVLAFGDPHHAGAAPEWIPVRAWNFLKRDPEQQDVVRGEGMSYFYVRVVSWADLERTSGALRVTAGRRPAGHKQHDQPRIEEMRCMLTAAPPQASSTWDAALAVSNRAAGGGTPQSKAKRLAKRYSEAFSAEKN